MFAMIMISCENEQFEPDKIILSTVIKDYEALSIYSMQKISEMSELQNADIALISYLNTDNVNNSQSVVPIVHSGALVVFSDLAKSKNVFINTDTLSITSPLIFPGYYYSGKKWKTANHGYSMDDKWNFVYVDQAFEINTQSQASLFPMNADVKDTFLFDKTLQINWTKSPTTGNKVYVSFKWYPSYSDSKYSKDFPGFECEDTGIYLIDKSILNSLNTPNYGILQVNVMRYGTSLQQVNGRSIFITNAVESSTSFYIKK